LSRTESLRALFLADRPDGAKPDWTHNMLLKHAFARALNMQELRPQARPFAVEPDLAPHLDS